MIRVFYLYLFSGWRAFCVYGCNTPEGGNGDGDGNDYDDAVGDLTTTTKSETVAKSHAGLEQVRGHI